MPDQIVLTGIRGTGHHGVLESERRDGQEFIVDVTLDVDARRAQVTDDLSDAVDYSAVAEAVHAIIEGEPVDLIETLAGRIADRCLAFLGVHGVRVTVHKPHAPISVPFDDVSVTITRGQA
jgi:7,8-dihydroneopterin aldolase/epimerase/oxygenase